MLKKIIIIITILLATSIAFGKTFYSFISPDHHGKKVKIQVQGKSRTYYELDRKHPAEIILEGPTVLKVYTRLDMKDVKEGKKVDYTIYCLKDGKKEHFTQSTKVSSIAKFCKSKSGQLGRGRSFKLKIGPGKHSVKLFLDSKDKSKVYVRLLKEKSAVSDRVDRVAITPVSYTKQVPILVKEQQYEYYRVGPVDSLSLRIIGPTTVKILARLEYDITTNGGNKLRVQALEDEVLKNTYYLAVKPSQVAVYTATGVDKTLSAAKTLYLEVPSGQHIYNFKVLDSGRNILLKFYIPTVDLNNTL